MNRPHPISWILNGTSDSQRLRVITGFLMVLILVGLVNATLLPRANITRLIPVVLDLTILLLIKIRPAAAVPALLAVASLRLLVVACLFAGPAVAVILGAKTERFFSLFLACYHGANIWLSAIILTSLKRKDVLFYFTKY